MGPPPPRWLSKKARRTLRKIIRLLELELDKPDESGLCTCASIENDGNGTEPSLSSLDPKLVSSQIALDTNLDKNTQSKLDSKLGTHTHTPSGLTSPFPQAHASSDPKTLTHKIDCPLQKNPSQISPTAPIRDSDPRIYTNVDIRGKIFPMLLDSGAACSWIGPGPAELLETLIEQTESYMQMPNGDIIRDDGAITLTLDLDGQQVTSKFKVSKSLDYDIIMGIDVMNHCKITCDHDRQTWSTPSGIQHSFFENTPLLKQILV